MTNVICRIFRDELAYQAWYISRYPPLGPTTQPTGSSTLLLLYLMKPVCLFAYSKGDQNQVHQPDWQKAPLYNVIRFSYITQFMKLCYDSFLQLK